MQPLASQSSPASSPRFEARSSAQMVEAIRPTEFGQSANDNQAAWTPSLLVNRRRRLSRRANRT